VSCQRVLDRSVEQYPTRPKDQEMVASDGYITDVVGCDDDRGPVATRATGGVSEELSTYERI
jgi:hypothetical protein